MGTKETEAPRKGGSYQELGMQLAVAYVKWRSSVKKYQEQVLPFVLGKDESGRMQFSPECTPEQVRAFAKIFHKMMGRKVTLRRLEADFLASYEATQAEAALKDA